MAPHLTHSTEKMIKWLSIIPKMADKDNLFYTVITLRLNSLWGARVQESMQPMLAVGGVSTYLWNFLGSLSFTFSTFHLWSVRNLIDLALFPTLVTPDKSPHSVLVFVLLTHLRYRVNWHFVSGEGSACSWKQSCSQWCFNGRKAVKEELVVFAARLQAGELWVLLKGEKEVILCIHLWLYFSVISATFSYNFSSSLKLGAFYLI